MAAAGRRVIVPWLRGYGPTRFLSEDAPRVGQQAALGGDLLALLDALKIERATLAGYDWGGRAACVVSALHPDRVSGLVSGGTGYNIQVAPHFTALRRQTVLNGVGHNIPQEAPGPFADAVLELSR